MTVDLAELLERFEVVVSALQPETATTYSHPLRRWSRWLDGREPSDDMARDWIDQLVQEGILKPNSISTYANALRRFWKWQGKALRIDAPKMDFELGVKYHPLASILRMLELANPLDKVVVALLYDTGCRLGEILKLTTDEIDWVERTLTVRRKGGRIETVPIMTDKAMETLETWNESRQGQSKELFLAYCTGNNYAQKSHWIRRRLKRLAKRAGITENFRPHDLRHSRAMHLVDAGAGIAEVSELLGHTSINVTAKVYTKRSAADRRKALAEKAAW